MNHIKSLLVGTALAVAAPVFAQGNTLPAMAGTAMIGSDWSCFNLSVSSVKNFCAGMRYWIMPLQMTSAEATKEVTIVGRASQGSSVICSAIKVSPTGATSASSPLTVTQFNWETKSTGFSMGLGSAVYLSCRIPGNNTGELSMIGWGS